MGIFLDRMVANYNKHLIEIEADQVFEPIFEIEISSIKLKIPGVARYKLVIDNKLAAEEKMFVGNRVLRGVIEEKQVLKKIIIEVVVSIEQGWFGTKYKLEIGGKEYLLRRVR